METPPSKSIAKVFLSSILVRLISFCVLVLVARFAFILAIKARSCYSPDFSFFPQSLNSAADRRRLYYYTSVFQGLVTEGILSTNSNSLCIETQSADEVGALREIGVVNSIGISSKKLSSQGTRYADLFNQPFKNDTFDFEFSGAAGLDRTRKPVQFAREVSRTLKPGGFFVVHTKSFRDKYRLQSLLRLLGKFKLIKFREIGGLDHLPLHELVLRKKNRASDREGSAGSVKGKSGRKCSVPRYKLDLIRNAEPLIEEEPLKPWITLSRNIKNVRYLPTMADISFKNRYIYIDVGTRGDGASIRSWFEKLYPKQDKQFEMYVIGRAVMDAAFSDERYGKKGFTVLPNSAWIRNETLFFEISREQSRKNDEKDIGMGRTQSVQPSSNFMADTNKIRGFDFAMWLKSTVGQMDYVVVKMDVEGIEFQLIPRLIETEAICLIDEMFLVCHYNRWRGCCPGRRRQKYRKTYAQCLELFSSLRQRGVLAHQWVHTYCEYTKF
ncbi:uncharacterized protein LOC127247557 [Andrographis paniculata]|uniref:uncharacterized protein LOC127247557 n=1 Tax=Andrographis paniculata TaxID=175694 RepID=UPI0021E8D6FC|nr:uncharacterized protein LOC127247557 [Andrographis paniculata]